MTQDIERYQTIEGLKTHPLYNLLTEKQQQFLIAYIELKGDRVAAAKKVYSEKRSEVSAVRLLRNGYVRKLIAIYYGYAHDESKLSKEELVDLISARLRSKTISDSCFTNLTNYFIELTSRKRKKGKITKPINTTEGRQAVIVETHIDDLVKELEKKKEETNGPVNPEWEKETNVES